MSAWVLLIIVSGAGAIGGLVASFTSEDKGFVLPTKVDEASGSVWRPGWVGLVVVGAVAAAVSYGLYGPIAEITAFGGPEPSEGTPSDEFGITFGALFAALLVGMGGSKYLSNQVDKVLLQETAATAAEKSSDSEVATRIGHVGPTEALRLAQSMSGPA